MVETPLQKISYLLFYLFTVVKAMLGILRYLEKWHNMLLNCQYLFALATILIWLAGISKS